MAETGDRPPGLATNRDQKLIAGIAYGLYALGLFGLLLPAIAAVIINYIKRDDSLPVYATHHTWMIRTFWWGLLWALVGTVLLLVLIGYAVLFVVAVWWLYRLIRGALWLKDERPMYPLPPA